MRPHPINPKTSTPICLFTESRRNPARSNTSKAGFALVSVLAILVLLVVLVLSISTVINEGTRTSASSKNLLLARQNALLGLDTAIGQLQEYAGKDQSVTFPATTFYPNKNINLPNAASPRQGVGDIFDNTTYGYRKFATTSTSRSYLEKVGTYLVPNERIAWDNALKTYWNANRNPRWTGIMDSSLRVDRATNPNGDPAPLAAQRYETNPATKFGEPKRDQLPVWLVSGNEKFTINQETDTDYPSGYQTPDTALPNPSADASVVYLVGTGTATDNSMSADGLDGRVKVKKQELRGKDSSSNSTVITGHYAYWVGDESTKANFTVRDPYFTAAENSVDYRNRLQVPQRVGWENMPGFGNASFSVNDEKLENINTSKEIGLLEKTKTAEIKTAAKQNFHSLTATSKSLLTDTALGGLKKDLTAYLDRNQGLTSASPIANPSLYNASDARFRAWNGTNAGFPNSSSAALDGIPTWGQLKDWYQNEASGSGGSITPTADTAPVLTYLMFHSGMSYDPATKRVRWHWLPCIVLWNPYSAPLASATYDLEIGISPWIWQMMFVKENPTLAELQKDVDAQWQGTEGDRSTYTFLDSTNTRRPLIQSPPDSVNMRNGPWPLDNNLTDGTTDAFGRFYYYGTKADSNMYSGYQGISSGSDLSALGHKAFPIRIGPHDGPSFSSINSLPVDRPLQFQVSGEFGPGEARVFTVPNDIQWTPGTPVTLTNQFQPDAPASLWFDLLTLANGPASATGEGVKWFYSQTAENIASPTVRLSIGGKTILESKTPLGSLGKLNFNSTGRDLFYYMDWGAGGSLSRHNLDDDGDGAINLYEPMPAFVHAWKPLYDSEDFAENAKTQDTKHTDSSIYGYGETFVRPFLPNNTWLVGGGVTNEENHDCLPVFSRFNLGAKSLARHPMVDWMRDFYGNNNYDASGAKEGLTRFNFIKSIDTNQNKWDDDQVDGNLGYALITERDFRSVPEPADYGYNRYRPLSTLAIRNAKRADSEILSLGQFQQANLSPYFWQPSFPIGNSDAGVYNDREAIAGIHSRKVGSARPPDPIPSWVTDLPKAVVKPNNAKRTDGFRLNGNPNGVTVDVPGNSMLDLSYLLNENLWDRFFLSTVTGTPNLTTPLPNSRLRFTPDAAGAGSALTNFDTAAAYLENVGALNVNSTSVEAWKALLTAFRDLKLKSPSGSENPDDTVPVSRTLTPVSGRVDFTPSNRNAADYGNLTAIGSKDYTKVVSGFRYLDDSMIQTLAERIVDEVRLRGPFLSLADFVNRRLDAPQGSGVEGSDWHLARTTGIVGSEPNDYLIGLSTDFMNPTYDPFIGLQGINGAIQRAINLSGINGGLNHPKLGADGTAAGDPNDRVYSIRIKNAGTEDYEPTGWHSAHNTSGIGRSSNTSGKHSTEPTMRSHIDSEHLAGAAAGEAGQLLQGAPGFVTQGDILAMIGPALTARGDTFLVRSYGDAVSKNGKVLARSYLEAVVQRLPDPVSAAGSVGEDQWRPISKFGRKFKIIKLRWLNPEEV